tara:strand:+ start:121 stop:846 length:726 start_codon:yes stop_codon:yes gene_type:complete
MSKTTYKEKNIKDFFKDWQLDHESREYLKYHSKRYKFLLNKISNIIDENKNYQILDIGPAYQTALLRNGAPDTSIDTMGFKDKRLPPRDKESHHEVNLNKTEQFVYSKNYDLIILAEVLEHLYTSPTIILNYLRSILNNNAYLIIQTPNASALWKRISLLLGKNPYEMIRINSDKNPGHFREYTSKELKKMVKEAGFKIIDFSINNNFNKTNLKHRVCDSFSNFLPQTFREGITICLQKTL